MTRGRDAFSESTRPADPRAVRDRELLVAVLEHPQFDELRFEGESPRAVFDGWLTRLEGNGSSVPLSDKQRAWLEGLASRLGVEIGAANLVSSGAVRVRPGERESLQQFLGTLDRPLEPPHRRKPK